MFGLITIIFSRSPTLMEIVSIVSKNVWFPFHYVADIVKDSVQLGLCVMVHCNKNRIGLVICSKIVHGYPLS